MTGRTTRFPPGLAGALASLALFTGCATQEFATVRRNLEFEVHGRIAVQHASDAFTANLAWRHGAESDELMLATALGQGLARIVRDRDRATLTTQDGRVLEARDIETLTERALGYRIPLDGLADWVRGRPAPGDVAVRRDESGRVSRIEQAGWVIDYLAWSKGDERPARLELRYPGLVLRLAISEWRSSPLTP